MEFRRVLFRSPSKLTAGEIAQHRGKGRHLNVPLKDVAQPGRRCIVAPIGILRPDRQHRRAALQPGCQAGKEAADAVADDHHRPPTSPLLGSIEHGGEILCPPFAPTIATALEDRKSTRLKSSTNAQLVCRLLLEKKK